MISQKFINEISQAFETKEELELFLKNCKNPLKKSIKINQHKISTELFINIVTKWGRTISDPKFIKQNNDIFYIDREDTSIALGNTFLHQSGIFYIQEVAAGMPARFLDIKEGDIVLDISSAPGGKTSQIGDYLLSKNYNNPGFVVANDVSRPRILPLAHNLNRMGIFNSGITNFNGFAFGKNLFEIFDHVLVDAPCSGEGTGFKSQSALQFWNIKEINKICGTQFQLLVSALKATKPGGTVVFSTCTINPYENEENLLKIVDFFGEDYIELEEVYINNKSKGISNYGEKIFLNNSDSSKVARFWPHIQNTGGFFISIIRKKKGLPEKFRPKINHLAPKNPFKLDTSKSLQKKVWNHLKEQFGIQEHKGKLFVEVNNKIFVTSPKFNEIKDKIGFSKIGTPIFKTDKSGLIPTHHLGTIFGHLATKNIVNLDEKTSQEYANYKDITLEQAIDYKTTNKAQFIILKWNNIGIGIGKLMENRIKNKYIR